MKHSKTELCSISVVIICISECFLPLLIRLFTKPKIARLFDSVPPDVKIISLSCPLICFANVFLAFCNAIFASTPIECIELGLPKTPDQYLVIEDKTLLSTGVVAELSRYIFFIPLEIKVL